MRDQHCPNLNCQVILPFKYANVWGFLTCPACASKLMLNDVYYPLHWLMVGKNPDPEPELCRCCNCGRDFPVDDAFE